MKHNENHLKTISNNKNNENTIKPIIHNKNNLKQKKHEILKTTKNNENHLKTILNNKSLKSNGDHIKTRDKQQTSMKIIETQWQSFKNNEKQLKL